VSNPSPTPAGGRFSVLDGASPAVAPLDGWGALMAAAQQGNGGAYRRLLGELKDWLTRFYARRLPAAAIEDAVQETLISVHEKRHTYDPRRPFKPWVAAIARYKWIDRLRAMRRRETEPLPDDIAVDDHESAVTSAIALRRLLHKLSPAQEEAIRLVKLDGLSVREASARSGQSESLVKVNIHRGLARLARLVQEESDED
jgi:RNA polymerase sigma-70 factor (ECF subfamily)